MVSEAFREAFNAQHTGEAALLLLTIDHPSFQIGARRFVNRRGNLISNGEEFVGAAFTLELPDDEEDRLPTVQLSIDNVDREIVAVVRSMVEPFTARMDLVRESDPDTLETTVPVMISLQADYDALTVNAELGFDNLLSEPFPADSFNPAEYPGLF